jgi:hypothetical protein
MGFRWGRKKKEKKKGKMRGVREREIRIRGKKEKMEKRDKVPCVIL